MLGHIQLTDMPNSKWHTDTFYTSTFRSSVEQRIEVLREVRKDVGVALHLAKQRQKEGYETGKKKAH
jgi:hypothetical protein